MLFANYHNSIFDARPYSLSGLEQPQAGYIQSSFGLMIGGPFQIPKLLKPSEKTSFFINYTGGRNRSPFDSTLTVPTEQERNGDFSKTLSQSGPNSGPVPIFDPQIPTGPVESRLFPGNRIPANRIDPIPLGLLKFIPLPNLPGSVMNYHINQALPSGNDTFSLRVNHRLTKKDNLSFNYSYSQRDGDLSLPFPALSGHNSNRGQNLMLGWVHNFGSRLFNNLNLRFNRMRNGTLNGFALVRDVEGELGITGVSSSPIDYGVPSLRFTNYASLSDTNPVLRRNQTFHLTDTLSWVKGKHTFRIGGEYRRLQLNNHSNPNGRGTFVFSGAITSIQGIPPQKAETQALPINTGYDFADFLLGLPQSTSIRYGTSDTYFRSYVLVGFVQDNWKVKSNLTLTAGLRYELAPPFYEKYNHIANLDIAPDMTAVQVVLPGEAGSFSGSFPRALIGTDWNNLAPRVGLAWRPFHKNESVVRAGYGIFFNPSVYNSFSTQLASQPPFAFSQNLVTSPDNWLTLANGFPPDPDTSVSNSYAVDKNLRIGYVQQWNLDLQQSLRSRFILTLGYNGSKGTRLDLLRAPNRVISGVTYSLIPGVQSFLCQTSGGSSSFHSGQVRLQRRFNRGLSFMASYIFGKSIDNASSIGGGQETVALYDNDLRLERGLSTFDLRHQFNAGWMLELPFGERKRFFAGPGVWNKIFSEWNWSGNLTANSGTPFTARVLGNSIGTTGTETNQSLRANATGLEPSLDGSQRTTSRYFETAAFSVPGAGLLGNAARNTLPGPGMFVVNVGLNKNIRISQEGRALTFRVQASNVFNTPNFSGLGTVVNASNFGRVTSVRQMRQIDFNLRIRF
jgi:hypothetical protein